MSKTHTLNEIKNKWDTIKDKGIEFANNVKEKSSEVAHTLETNPKTKSFWHYVKKHKKESILGTFMLLGLLFSFYWLGSVIVGLAAGLYAPWGIKGLWNKAMTFADQEGPFPTFVLVVAGVFMLFHIWFFVVGAAIGLGIKSIMLDEFVISAPTKKVTEGKK